MRRTLLLTLLLLGCGSAGMTGTAGTGPGTSTGSTGTEPGTDGPATTPASTTGALANVSIKAFKFTPDALTVPIGSTVTWVNDEDSLHTVTAGTPDERTGLFDSGEIDTGESLEFTFDEPGTYAYFCDRHEFMTGAVEVVAP